MSRSGGDLRGRLIRADRHAGGRVQVPVLAEGPQRREGVGVRAVVAGIEGRADRLRGDHRRDRDPLVDRDVRPDLQHLAATVGDQLLPLRVGRDLARQRLGLPLSLGPAPVQRDDRALVLDPDAGPLQLGAAQARDEIGRVALVAVQGGIGLRLRVARQQELVAVVPRIRDRVEADDPPGVSRGAPADARDQGVAFGNGRQKVPDLARDRSRLGDVDDRRDRPVYVGQDRRRSGVRSQRLDQGLLLHRS